MADWIRSIQYKGLKVVAGAFKATSTAALEIECYVKPIPQQLDKHLWDAAMRIRTSPIYQYIKEIRYPEGVVSRTVRGRRRNGPGALWKKWNTISGHE